MLIKDLGGEFKLLDHLLRQNQEPAAGDLIVPNGDDAAVLSCGAGGLVVVSTDCYLEGRHFRFDYSTPEDVGIKIIEGSASDIVAMGALPRFVFLAMWLPADWKLARIEQVFAGIHSACRRIGAQLAGGDTSAAAGGAAGFAVTVTGEPASAARICRRSGARPGDRIFVSGPLGGAQAGLELLAAGRPGFEELKLRHRRPRCRSDLAAALAPVATAMIDISDGLDSELRHIAAQSGVGCEIDLDKIPQPPQAGAAARELGRESLDWALGGGEDFELLYTVPPGTAGVPGFEIGTITSERLVCSRSGAQRTELPLQGWDHFT